LVCPFLVRVTLTLINDFPHHRNFGIELEFYNLTHEKVASLLRRAGIQCWSDNEYCEETDCTGDEGSR
jgi:hypothetical protein